MDGPRTFECPSCGGELTTDGLTPTIQCPYCGQTVTVPEDMRVKPPAPQPAPESQLVPLIKAAEEYAQEERAERLKQERPAAPAPRRSGCGCGPLIFAVVLILAVLVGGAIFTGNGPLLLSIMDTASGATPTPKPISRTLTASLPRSTRYAGVVFTVTGGELTNVDPNANGATRYRSDRLYAILSLKLDNAQGDRGVSLLPDVVRLQLADGNQYENDGSFGIDVGGAATRTGRLIFRVPVAANWTGAKLIVRETKKEPAVLPLDGQAPPVPEPLNLKLATEKTAGTIVYRVLSATVDSARDGNQVDQGQRFLRFRMRVVNNSKESGGVAVSGSNFRLLADGDSLAPDQSLIEAIPPQSQVDGNVDFTIPGGAKNVVLQVSELNGPHAQIPVNLKP